MRGACSNDAPDPAVECRPFLTPRTGPVPRACPVADAGCPAAGARADMIFQIMPSQNTFHTRAHFTAGGRTVDYFSLPALAKAFPAVERLPFSLRILLENLLRREDGGFVTAERHRGAGRVGPGGEARRARDRLHAGARAAAGLHRRARVVDLAAMRDAMPRMGGDPTRINPLQPVDLVIDHSVQVDHFGTAAALRAQRRARVRAQPRALRLPALGPGRVPQLPRRAARAPASCTR